MSITKNDEVACIQAEQLIKDFASRGLVLLPPDQLGISPDIHGRIYEQEKKAYHEKRPVTPSSIPDVLDILNAPGLVSACDRLIGKNWAIVPFTHNASFTSGGRDQHWHKDDNGPYNSRKQRHHQAVQIEMLYYPQAVLEDMGPTATIPYSHYWTFNHEENHDNFAGAEHLDFTYHYSGMEREPVSGEDSNYTEDDILNRRTAHDIRMRDAVTGTGWSLVEQFEAAPLRAGSILLYSHNTFHRGNHRRDDWRSWRDNPRFMWRFWLYRTTDASVDESPPSPTWTGIDPLTNTDLSNLSDDITSVWRYHHHWIHTTDTPPPRPEAASQTESEREQEAARLAEQIFEKGESAEPQRIGAAYRLASVGDTALAIRHLKPALYDDRESVRRAATNGLIAVGPDATVTFIEAAASQAKWVRKAGVYGIGDTSPLTVDTLKTVVSRLETDPSVYVRSVAAGSLGCLGRRAIRTGVGTSLIPACFDALLQSLEREDNRLAMDLAQGRSIKLVRPTDDSDVCEGNGIDFGHERFEKVRSTVRENVLWSIVILTSHGAGILGKSLKPTIAALREVVRTDKNVICVGYALDALGRLANLHPEDETPNAAIQDLQSNFTEVIKETPVRGWEALVRGGVSPDLLTEFRPQS